MTDSHNRVLNDNFRTVVAIDLFNSFAGNEIGSGSTRLVWEYAPNPDYVLKIEPGGRSFANVREYEFWEEFKNVPHIAKWLAPVEWISPAGTIIVQRRAMPLLKTDKLPAKIPAIFTDIHYRNFGWLDGRVVCVDYALNLQNSLAATKRMRPSKRFQFEL